MTAASSVRVRFCPSPTGTPHVGLVRTALFNWAYARHNGGTFVFRIEDTDAQRDSVESYEAILDALRWLGLDWDEGPQVGGPHGPYRQSERRDTYRDALGLLVQAGEVYESYSTAEEIEARHRAAGRDPKLGYDNADRDLTEEQKAAFRAEGRRPVFRLRMPDRDITFTDLIRGEITFKAGAVPDFVLARGDGTPLYPLTNPLDDALMGITHVLRGEDLLPSTPRQIALFEALARVGIGSGRADVRAPAAGHRRGQPQALQARPAVEPVPLPRPRLRPRRPAQLSGAARLVAPGRPRIGDRDVFTLAEMVEAFDVSKVSANTARFDIKKAEAINSAHLRMLAPDDFARRLEPYLVAELAGTAPVMTDTLADEQRPLLVAAAPLVQERSTVLSDAALMLRFLFVDDAAFAPDPDAAAKNLGADAAPVLEAALTSLDALDEWSAPQIEAALKAALVDGLGLKPRKAFAPVRVAVTGRTVSPPLYESMELLGRERSLARLRAGFERAGAVG